MRVFARAIWTACVVATCCASLARADVAPAVSWSVSGDASIAPSSVVERGGEVFIRLKNIFRVPAILMDGPGGPKLMHWRLQTPFIVVANIPWRLIFRAGDHVAYAVPPDPFAPPAHAATPHSTTPALGGRKDDATVAVGDFVLRKDDSTVAMALARWSGKADWDVRWDSAIQVPITASSADLGADFITAVQAVVTGLQQAGYPLAVTFSGRTVHIYEPSREVLSERIK